MVIPQQQQQQVQHHKQMDQGRIEREKERTTQHESKIDEEDEKEAEEEKDAEEVLAKLKAEYLDDEDSTIASRVRQRHTHTAHSASDTE